MEWVSGQFPGFLLVSTDSGNCWSVLRNSQTLSDLALQQSTTCGFEIGNWVCLNRAFANSWTREQYTLKLEKLERLVSDIPRGVLFGPELRQDIVVLLIQLCEASRTWGGTLSQGTLLRLCDMLQVGAILFEKVFVADHRTGGMFGPGVPTHNTSIQHRMHVLMARLHPGSCPPVITDEHYLACQSPVT